MVQETDPFNFIGRCFSCKKNTKLADFSGLKLCKDCADKFDDELIKKYEEEEYGRDILNDKKLKQKD